MGEVDRGKEGARGTTGSVPSVPRALFFPSPQPPPRLHGQRAKKRTLRRRGNETGETFFFDHFEKYHNTLLCASSALMGRIYSSLLC